MARLPERPDRLEIAAIRIEKNRDVRVGLEQVSARHRRWPWRRWRIVALRRRRTASSRKCAISSSPQSTAPAPLVPGDRIARRHHRRAGAACAAGVRRRWRRPRRSFRPVAWRSRSPRATAATRRRSAPALSGASMRQSPMRPACFRLIKEDRGAAPTFVLPPGNYVVHASLGLASAAKAVQLRAETVREVFDIPAGGMRLEGRVGDVRIPTGQISFDIFTGSQFDTTRAPADRAERDDRRRRAAARRHLLHRVELRRRQFGGALRRAYRGRPSSPISW